MYLLSQRFIGNADFQLIRKENPIVQPTNETENPGYLRSTLGKRFLHLLRT